MARSSHDREDLLGEATALVERVELLLPDQLPIVVGFRVDGAASVFFGADPVYQFNARGEFRRGYWEGKLIKADRRQLVSLERNQEPHATFLMRTEWPSEKAESWLEDAARRLAELRERLVAGSFHVVGQVPVDADVVGRTIRWLEQLPSPLPIADRPNVGKPPRG